MFYYAQVNILLHKVNSYIFIHKYKLSSIGELFDRHIHLSKIHQIENA